ncbi:MAG: isoprenylcysteine carboxylmethyltransferase family protein [Candidatus Aminicenantales bacterium]
MDAGNEGVAGKRILAARVVLTIAFIVALVFVPAGTLKWPEAWALLFLYLTVVAGVMLWWKKHSPGLLRERMSRKKKAKSWDKAILAVYTPLLLFLLVLPGLDAVRFGWSKLPFGLKLLGFLGYVPAMAIALWAMKENAFLSDVVRIQTNRGHTVCATGPYKHVRHPMYLGVIFFFLCFPLSLGSWYSYVPASLIVVLFVIRTALEDKTLKAELPGYAEYSERVRFRLVPRVW